MDCNPPGSSVDGISQARILEWVVILFSRGSSWPRAQTHVSCLAGRSFITEPPGKSELLFRWEQSQGVEVSPTVVQADSALPLSLEKSPLVHLQECLTGNTVMTIICLLTPEKQLSETLAWLLSTWMHWFLSEPQEPLECLCRPRCREHASFVLY